jgi:hypothetical protein
MTVLVKVAETPDGAEWPVDVEGTAHRINGYAELRKLIADYPDAQCHLHANQEIDLRRADIERAIGNHKSRGRVGWTSSG